MAQWKKLVYNTPKVTPSIKETAYGHIGVYDLDITYDEKKKTELFSGIVLGDAGNRYNVFVTFKNIDIVDGLTEEEFIQGFKPKPKFETDTIQVGCTCPNYQHRFYKPNEIHNANSPQIKFGPYHPHSNRFPYNPKNREGYCKHIYKFVEYLRKNNFFQ